MRRTGPTLLGISMLLGTAACGSGGSGSSEASSVDQAAITKLSGDVSLDKTPSATCGQLLSDGFVSTVYGNPTTCAAAQDRDPADTPSGANVTSISVKSDTATAKVTQQFGAAVGASGTWEFARSAGAWQVSGWDVDYLRAYVDSLFGANYQSADPTSDPIADATYRACIDSTLQATDDSTLRTLAYGLLSDRNTQLGQTIVGCDAKAPGGKSPFWAVLESGLRSGAGGSALSDKISNCMITGLHAKFSDAQITNETLNGSAKSDSKELDAAMTAVGNQCGHSVAGLPLPKVKKSAHAAASVSPTS